VFDRFKFYRPFKTEGKLKKSYKKKRKLFLSKEGFVGLFPFYFGMGLCFATWAVNSDIKMTFKRRFI
jgi:hypothetical protein